MNVHIANFDPVKIGGGWTATRYLYEGLSCVDYDQADVYLITGASMVNHSDVEKAKQDGKRIVADPKPQHGHEPYESICTASRPIDISKQVGA